MCVWELTLIHFGKKNHTAGMLYIPHEIPKTQLREQYKALRKKPWSNFIDGEIFDLVGSQCSVEILMSTCGILTDISLQHPYA